MADTGIFATTAEIVRKAGANASATATDEAYTNDFISQAESKINCETRKNWSDAYSTLNVDVRGILKEAGSNLAAIYVIEYDMSGFTSRAEAELKVKILYRLYKDAIKLLQDQQVKTFMERESA